MAGFRASRPDHARGTMLHVWNLATVEPHSANSSEQGHLDEVDGLAFAPDGRTIASLCTGDRSVRLWDAATGRLRRSISLGDHRANYHSLTFSPDGKTLFMGTSPAVIRWDVATGKEVDRYPLFGAGKGDRYHLLVMHLADDGRTLLAVSQNLEARQQMAWGLHAWDLKTGKRLRSEPLTAEDNWVSYSQFSADGRQLALPGNGIRDAATGKELFRLAIEGKYVDMPVAFSPDGALAASGVWQEIKHPYIRGREMIAVQVWELATLLPIARLETGPLAHLAFTPDGRRLITAGLESLALWDLASGHPVSSKPAPGRFRGSFGSSFASSLAVAPDGHTVATGQPDATVLLWDLQVPSQPAAALTAAELETSWTNLAAADAGRAMTALARLADVPKQAVPLLRERLRSARAPAADELRRLLADLDDADFARREAATKRLTEMGELAAEAALKEALRAEPSAEVRRRLKTLLAEPRLVRAAEDRRHLRAVRILEGIGSPEARRVLEKLSGGVAEARLTREARAALGRLERRSATTP